MNITREDAEKLREAIQAALEDELYPECADNVAWSREFLTRLESFLGGHA